MHWCLKAVKLQPLGKLARKSEIEIEKRGLNAQGPGRRRRSSQRSMRAASP